MAKPTKPLTDAISEYQSKNPYSQQSFEGLFPYLSGLGYNVARTTHAGNTLASNDALVDDTGNVYDLVFNSDNAPDAGAAKWVTNQSGTYDSSRKVVGPDGSFIGYDDWLKSVGGTPGGAPAPAGSTPPPSSVSGSTPPVPSLPQYQGKPGTVAARLYGTIQGRLASAAQARGQGTPGTTNPYEAGAAAAARARLTAQRGGRRSTILAGFGAGAPSTRPATALGS